MPVRIIVGMLAVRPPHHRRPLGQPVLDDWDRLVARQRDLAVTLTAAGFIPRSGRPRPRSEVGDPGDRALATLVRDAALDAGAARVVLQRILPGLVAIARRRGGGNRGRTHEAFDELLAVGWIVIRIFPVDRRRGLVAANLLRDIEYHTFAAPRRRVMVRREIPCCVHEDDLGCRVVAASAFDEVVEVLTDGRDAGLPPDDIRFAASLASGGSTAEWAATRRVTHRAERYRRRRVASALRAASLGWGSNDATC